MRIAVCIKQVPNTTEVKINPKTNTLIREGVESIINPFDMYAIEEALRLKEKFNAETFVITMGPPQAESALKEAISMGIDNPVLVSDRAFAGSDTWATSLTLAKAIEKIGNIDLIICGKQASDGDTAQVGPGIAAHLNIPQATYVNHIKNINIEEKWIEVSRLLENGFEILRVELPALITVVKEINEPRTPSLKGKMRAKSIQIPVFTNKELQIPENMVGLNGSPTQVVEIFTPSHKVGGKIFQGDPDHIIDQFILEIKDLL
ncbi:MAG: electron transfer flavoprotein subunit beta/FixA family protein [Spirochaetales bacterium]|jgi:electron transfer flavoprotein beta subunit|nr:electron transfer flavoprotein subunit beta/FixA family protein [Exilispira sp.]NMC68144.1 electron transfer flavoprotein subunit beta/FixA family protein [Spirochaetales bacterium]